MDQEWKPSLIQFLKRLLLDANKPKFYEVGGIKYFENKNTNLVSRILLYFGIIIFSQLFRNILDRIEIYGFIRVFLYIIYGIMMAVFCEIIHWTYAKYEKRLE